MNTPSAAGALRIGEGTRGVVVIDGKTLRHSFDRGAGGSALHPNSAWAADQRLAQFADPQMR